MSEEKKGCCCGAKTTQRAEEQKKKLVNRLKRLEGQIRGVQAMVEQDAYCNDILIQSAAVNAANEEAVGLFLAEKIDFYDIPRLVAQARAEVAVVASPTLEDILEADRLARESVLRKSK